MDQSERYGAAMSGAAPRCAVVDLGSNSVRLVVYEGRGRNPVPIFNEKAVLKLGKGLQTTGRLNEAGVTQALKVMVRYHVIARAMQAAPFEVLATAAVRDASNGPAFVAALQEKMPGATIRVLSGKEEAELSAAGLHCGIAGADGVLADIGGGSLELVQLDPDGVRNAVTLRLGVIRLADRSEGNLERARDLADADLGDVPWLGQGTDRSLYLVGGAWRALARMHMQHVKYPLSIVHCYTIGQDAARELTLLATAPGKLAGAPRRRADDLPYAGVVLRRLLRATGAKQVVFSAYGIREGWFMQAVPPTVRAEDPLMTAVQDDAQRLSRDITLPPALIDWTALLFPFETATARRLRQAACWMSDTGSHDHPEYRAEFNFQRSLYAPGPFDHPTRAFLALVLATRYEAEPDASYLTTARSLLDPASIARAELLGCALRLAYTLSAGTPDLLTGAAVRLEPGRVVLRLDGPGVFAGEGVQRRLDRLANRLGLTAAVEVPCG
ncbi:MAG: Ppx/GppA family phosphatase [Acetobacteraceae bacterium]|nr:Ppx/GppA family phosphatase [Acetobacteraceae bacterium]